jgi:hypothetical protein
MPKMYCYLYKHIIHALKCEINGKKPPFYGIFKRLTQLPKYAILNYEQQRSTNEKHNRGIDSS